jgi:spore coat protein CotH
VGVRLKGNPATFLPGGRMQFRIDIDRYTPDQDFHGYTSLNLEASAYDPTGLKNGLALTVFHDAGIVSSAANHAELWVNGSYYGVYENIEQINGRFLHHHYGDPDGNLYWFIWNGHYGELRSNEDVGDTSDWDAMEALVNATPTSVSLVDFAARIRTMVDLDELLLAFAAEAVIPQTDGVWAGSANCYMYDDPLGCDGQGCFQYLPWDLDSTFLAAPPDLCPACGTAPDTVTADPITYITGRGPAAKWRLYDLLMQIPEYQAQYVDDLQLVLDRAYDPDTLGARHAAMVEQLRPYEETDPHADLDRFDASNEELSAFFAQRRAFLDAWLAARH